MKLRPSPKNVKPDCALVPLRVFDRAHGLSLSAVRLLLVYTHTRDLDEAAAILHAQGWSERTVRRGLAELVQRDPAELLNLPGRVGRVPVAWLAPSYALTRGELAAVASLEARGAHRRSRRVPLRWLVQDTGESLRTALRAVHGLKGKGCAARRSQRRVKARCETLLLWPDRAWPAALAGATQRASAGHDGAEPQRPGLSPSITQTQEVSIAAPAEGRAPTCGELQPNGEATSTGTACGGSPQPVDNSAPARVQPLTLAEIVASAPALPPGRVCAHAECPAGACLRLRGVETEWGAIAYPYVVERLVWAWPRASFDLAPFEAGRLVAWLVETRGLSPEVLAARTRHYLDRTTGVSGEKPGRYLLPLSAWLRSGALHWRDNGRYQVNPWLGVPALVEARPVRLPEAWSNPVPEASLRDWDLLRVVVDLSAPAPRKPTEEARRAMHAAKLAGLMGAEVARRERLVDEGEARARHDALLAQLLEAERKVSA